MIIKYDFNIHLECRQQVCWEFSFAEKLETWNLFSLDRGNFSCSDICPVLTGSLWDAAYVWIHRLRVVFSRSRRLRAFFIFFKIDIQMELLALRNIIYRKIRTIIKVSKKIKNNKKFMDKKFNWERVWLYICVWIKKIKNERKMIWNYIYSFIHIK